MKIYTLSTCQVLPITLEEAWHFFSDPANLGKITPEHMNFRILYRSGNGRMYPGQLIRYKVNILPTLFVHWVTEITHVKEGSYFIDEQRFGPFRLWHHQHHFQEVMNGVEMKDEVNYALPLGFIGRLVHTIFVDKQVKAIFAYRKKVLEKHFQKPKAVEV